MGDRILPRMLTRVAAMDACAWVVFAAAGLFLDRAEALVALGPAIVVPLGVALALDSGEVGAPRPMTRLAANAVALGAPCGLGCFVVGGSLASLLAVAWLVATALVALEGARRILRRGFAPLADLAIDVGHLYLPIGAVWLAASRANVPLLGFTQDIVLFTAAHFHFAGFGAPVVAGLVGRVTTGRVYAASTVVVLLGIPLVAAGIQLSRALEMPSAIVLALGMLGLAAMLARTALGWLRGEPPRRLAGALLAIAPASLVLSMALAVAFTTTGSATRGAGESLIPYARMAELHGAANAIGFAVAALVAFTLAPPAPRGWRSMGSSPRPK
jgi:hypothetical protein